MADRMVLTDVDSIKAVNALARKRGIEPSEALTKLISVAVSRLGATDKYYESKAKGGKKAKAKAKAKPAKKSGKAKGPLARKVKRAKKAAPALAAAPQAAAQ